MRKANYQMASPNTPQHPSNFDDLFKPFVKRRKIIDQLREKYPDQKWTVVHEGFHWGYVTETGWHAGWRSCLAPRHDGDDDSFESRFYGYKPNAPTEHVFFS